MIIAFCFGALMEALAGFGTPVAISAVMLIGLGFRPIKAASLALVANTAPVAFGAIAIPIVTLSEITGLDKGDLGAMVGRQTPFLALIVPLILIAHGRRRAAESARPGRWPSSAASRSRSASSPARTSSRWRSPTSWRRSSSTACIVGLLRVWQPGEPLLAEDAAPRTLPAAGRGRRVRARPGDGARDRAPRRHAARTATADVLRAYAPYLIIIAVLSIAQIPAIKDALAKSPWTTTFDWPGLDVRHAGRRGR